MNGRSTLISVVFAAGVAASGPARAQAPGVTEIWKCQEANGRYTYTNDRRDTAGKKCDLVSREVNVVSPQKQPPRPPAAAASEARAAAKDRQRQILESELKKEEDALGKAQKELADQEAVRSGGERNYARVLERLQPYKDNVELHQKNVDALKRELGNL